MQVARALKTVVEWTKKCMAVSTLTLLTLGTSQQASARTPEPPSSPILIIGASMADGRLPFNDSLMAPLGGIAVGVGSYLSLGAALTRTHILPGFVINEAQAGATTFSREACFGQVCGMGEWQGYDTQLAKALARVTVRNPANPSEILSVNAKYVVISLANDCLHSDAFGIPQRQAVHCSSEDIDGYLDRLENVIQTAIAAGLTPIMTLYPKYENLNLRLTQRLFGMIWIADKAEYNAIRDRYDEKVRAISGALIVNAWKRYRAGPDGLHPDPQTSIRAARRIAAAIIRDKLMKSRQ